VIRVINRYMIAQEFLTRFDIVRSILKRNDKNQILEHICSLSKPTNPDDLDAIIGNDSLTHVSCRNCGKERLPYVFEIDDGKYYITVCQKCIDDAMERFHETPNRKRRCRDYDDSYHL